MAADLDVHADVVLHLEKTLIRLLSTAKIKDASVKVLRHAPDLTHKAAPDDEVTIYKYACAGGHESLTF